MRDIRDYQRMVLEALRGKIDDFYLAGGTALSLFYFQHRLSADLDFFTRRFSSKRVEDIAKGLKESLKKEIKLTAQIQEKGAARMAVYNIYFKPSAVLKIDFVEDLVDLIKKPRIVEGVKILSLEDIYLRKIYAVCGAIKVLDKVGREKFVGGRIDAKDFYDLYFLSHTFMPLSRFSEKFCNATMIEGLIKWFRQYDRITVIDGLLSLETNKRIDYKDMERHFKKEIEKIVEKEIRGI